MATTRRLKRKEQESEVSATNPIVVAGVSVSVVLGAASYFLTDRGFALALIVSLTGVVLTTQLEVITRLERRHHREDTHSHLMAALDEVPWLSPVMKEMADAMCTMSSAENLRRLVHIARSCIDECSTDLQELKLGQYRVRAEDCEVLFEQTARADHTIHATSVTYLDLAWWSADVGRKYWDANIAAMKRGVEIERVFIYETWVPELERLASEHADAGVRVYVVCKDNLPDDLRIDMIVWDDAFLYEIELNSDGVEIFNRFSVNKTEVERRARQFAVIRSRARIISPGAAATDTTATQEQSVAPTEATGALSAGSDD
jgi:hypothetical protein